MGGLAIICHPFGSFRGIIKMLAVDFLFGIALHPFRGWMFTACVVPAAVVHIYWSGWEMHE